MLEMELCNQMWKWDVLRILFFFVFSYIILLKSIVFRFHYILHIFLIQLLFLLLWIYDALCNKSIRLYVKLTMWDEIGSLTLKSINATGSQFRFFFFHPINGIALTFGLSSIIKLYLNLTKCCLSVKWNRGSIELIYHPDSISINL